MKLISTSISALLSATFHITTVTAHGATSFPPSRQWLCSGGAAPNAGVSWNGWNGPAVCSPNVSGDGINTVITDWSGVAHGNAAGHSNTASYQADPRQAHIDAMGQGLDSKICSGNLDKYKTLEKVSWAVDQGEGGSQKPGQFKPYPTPLKNGPTQFTYSVTAAHQTYSTGYIDTYVTKEGTDFSKPLTWNDLEAAPICHYVPEGTETPLQRAGLGGHETFDCVIPQEKIGKHVLFQVWQRNDSDEAFYSCSDVLLSSGDFTKPEQETTTETVTDAVETSTSSATQEPDMSTSEIPICLPNSEITKSRSLFDKSGKIYASGHSQAKISKVPHLTSSGSKNSKIRLSDRTESNLQFEWQLRNTNQIQLSNSEALESLCWEIRTSKKETLKLPSYQIRLNTCNDDKLAQLFQYDVTSGEIQSFIDQKYCVALSKNEGEAYLRPCVGLVREEIINFGL